MKSRRKKSNRNYFYWEFNLFVSISIDCCCTPNRITATPNSSQFLHGWAQLNWIRQKRIHKLWRWVSCVDQSIARITERITDAIACDFVSLLLLLFSTFMPGLPLKIEICVKSSPRIAPSHRISVPARRKIHLITVIDIECCEWSTRKTENHSLSY